MLPWEQRGAAPSKWFVDLCGSSNTSDDVDRTLERGLHRRPVSINELPDFSSWQPTSYLRLRLLLPNDTAYVFPSLPSKISVQVLWLLLAGYHSPEDATMAWGGLALLRPERSLAAYSLPSQVDLWLWVHSEDAFSVLVVWKMIRFSAYVRPAWPVENLRKTIAFQIGVHPHQLSMKVDGAQLMGGTSCGSMSPGTVIVTHIHGFPQSFDCELCPRRREAISLCNDCGRTTCCAHRRQCAGCQQLVCVNCRERHRCMRITEPIEGQVVSQQTAQTPEENLA